VKLPIQPSLSIQALAWSSVSAPLTRCRPAQNPPVIRTSRSPSGRRAERDGTTGRPPVRSTPAGVVTMRVLQPERRLTNIDTSMCRGAHHRARKPFRQGSPPLHSSHRDVTAPRRGKGVRVGRQRSGSVTLSDVAKLAGVSVATASKALNARAEVAPATRERVVRAATELSFQPNVLARGLISGRTRTVGLLTDELAGRFSIPILLGAENALGNGQMSVLLCDARGDSIRRQHYIRTLMARQVDGFIVVGDSNDVRPSLTSEIPVPVVYAYCESTDPRDLSVLADDEGGARLAIEHLVSHNRRRIGHITGPESYRAARDRVIGLRAVLRESGLTLAGDPLYGEWSQRWGRHAARMLLTAHPDVDAVFCGNDQIATGVADTLRDLGQSVPDDVAVVGYDNWIDFAADCRPPLTTVDLNLEHLGATAAHHLFAALEGDRASGVIRQPGRLVVRESTGPLPRR
jgi:LacI family transcriptional regulator